MKAELLGSALELGQIDAAIVLEPAATIAVSKGSAHILESALFDKHILHSMPISASVFSTAFAKNNPSAVSRLVAATDRAIEFINTHGDETKSLLPKYTEVDPIIAQKLSLATFLPHVAIGKNDLQALADLLTKEHELSKTIPTETLIYR